MSTPGAPCDRRCNNNNNRQTCAFAGGLSAQTKKTTPAFCGNTVLSRATYKYPGCPAAACITACGECAPYDLPRDRHLRCNSSSSINFTAHHIHDIL